MASWKSPDGRIEKFMLSSGAFGSKPLELSECEVKISECPLELEEFNNSSLIIGNNDGDLGRFLDVCLMTMNEKEIAKFTLTELNVSFVIELVRLQFGGFIYEWDAAKKMSLAVSHKDKGVQLFKIDRNRDAAFRFIKALKILHSIPLDSEFPPEDVDGVAISDIKNLKAILYNNLASYYLKKQAWLTVIDLCKKVFTYDSENCKAFYKIGVAYMNDRNYVEAEKAFEFVLKHEQNKAAAEYLKNVKDEIRKSNLRVNELVKKMFQ